MSEHKYNVGDVVELEHWGRVEIIEVLHPGWSKQAVYTGKLLNKITFYEDEVEFSHTEHGDEDV